MGPGSKARSGFADLDCASLDDAGALGIDPIQSRTQLLQGPRERGSLPVQGVTAVPSQKAVRSERGWRLGRRPVVL